MHTCLYAGFCLWLMLLNLSAQSARTWPQFRGPNGSGVASDGDLPVDFGPQTNLLWKTELGPGHSSPCIWADAIFLTAQEDEKLVALCLDRISGSIRWRREAPAERLEKVSSNGSPAASTPVTDGTRVVVYFGSFGLLAYNFQGDELWRKPLPTPVTQHGTGTSPILADGSVVLNCDQDVGSYLLAVAAQDGHTLWRTDRPGFRRGFTTPVRWHTDAADWIVVAGTLRLVAYDLRDGRERWQLAGLPNEMCASPVLDKGFLYVAGWTPGSGDQALSDFATVLAQADKDHDGRLSRAEAPPGPAQAHFAYLDADKDGYITREEWDKIAAIFAQSQNALLALRPGTDSEHPQPLVVWKQTRGLPYVPSPLVYRDRVYLVKNGGLLSSFNATNGTALYQEQRLGVGGDYYASPVAANGKICAISQRGIAVVFQAADTLKVLARNDLGERVMATPAIVGKHLYLRTEHHLYAFSKSS